MIKKLGLLLMAMGIAMVAFSAYTFFDMEKEEQQIEKANQLVLTKMAENIRHLSENPGYVIDPYSEKMTGLMVDGYEYIGCLSIPDIEIELPVMSQLDEYRLKLAPCLYQGTLNSNNMIIGAHNYKKHFANLFKLEPGDSVVFTTMDGTVTFFAVASLETLLPEQQERLVQTDSDLTLFTCTYGGQKRTVVRCERLDSDGLI